jgi:hypothetical protein
MSSVGVFHYDLAGFAGNYFLQIDTDNNGAFNDSVDREIPIGGGSDTDLTVAFDGKDGQGQAIPDGSTFSARMYFVKTGEMHLVIDDVEYLGGLTMTRTNGPGSPSSTIYWNDTNLSTANRSTPTSPLDGRGGVDSNTPAGVHGWANHNIRIQWGDERRLDNWAFGPELNHATATFTAVPPAVSSAKTSAPSSGSAVLPGQTVDYTLTFTAPATEPVTINTTDSLAAVLDDAELVGTISSSNPSVTVGSPDSNGVFAITGSLAAGDSAVVTYQVRAKDFEAQGDHMVTNTLACDPYELGCSPRVTTNPVAHLTLDHTASTPSGNTLVYGDDVVYSYLVTNTGRVPLSDISITEEDFTGSGSLSVISCPPGTVAVGDSVTCTATYPVAQADIDRGSVASTAHAAGLTPIGSSGEPALNVVSAPDDVSIPSNPDPALTFVKTASAVDEGQPLVGQIVDYEFLVANTGNVSLSDIAIEELTFTGTPSPAISCPASTLAPTASMKCTAGYAVTQADVDAGFISNTARAAGTTPDKTQIHSSVASANTQLPQKPGMQLVKSANTSSLAVGATVTYTYTVSNTGNVTVSDIGIDETGFDGKGTTPATPVCANTTLAPGASTTCTTTYQVTQADVDQGSVTNKAKAHGKPPVGAAFQTAEDQVTLTAAHTPALSLVKTASPNTPASFTRDQLITYSFAVLNTGNVTLNNVGVTETAFDGRGTAPAAPVCLSTTLAPGASTTCTTTYQLVQADIDAESVTNKAKAHGTPPAGGTTESAESQVTLMAVGLPAIAVTKIADTSGLSTPIPWAGDQVVYHFTLTNTGNVTLHDARIDDGLVGLSPLTYVWPDPSRPAVLDTGATATATAGYAITQDDLHAGQVANIAFGKAKDPIGREVVDSVGAAFDIPLASTPSLVLTRTVRHATETSGTATSLTVDSPADLVYEFTILNAGNVTVTDVGLEHEEFTGTGQTPELTCPAAEKVLTPGAVTQCEVDYSFGQSDVDLGDVLSWVRATGKDHQDQPVASNSAQALVEAIHLPSVDMTITTSLTREEDYLLGAPVVFTIVATNTGNVTLRDPGILVASFSGSGELSKIECPPVVIFDLGDTMTCTANYVLTQADVDAQEIHLETVARGTSPGSRAVGGLIPTTVHSLQDLVRMAGLHGPLLELVKSSSVASGDRLVAGEQITYTFTVANTGNVTLTDVEVNETRFTGSGKVPDPVCPTHVLAPFEEMVCTAAYTVTKADLTARSIDNTAVATAIGPVPASGAKPARLSAESSVTIPLPPLVATGGTMVQKALWLWPGMLSLSLALILACVRLQRTRANSRSQKGS